jgi:hypothetical protein
MDSRIGVKLTELRERVKNFISGLVERVVRVPLEPLNP